jgi:hypothetical protein
MGVGMMSTIDVPELALASESALLALAKKCADTQAAALLELEKRSTSRREFDERFATLSPQRQALVKTLQSPKVFWVIALTVGLASVAGSLHDCVTKTVDQQRRTGSEETDTPSTQAAE